MRILIVAVLSWLGMGLAHADVPVQQARRAPDALEEDPPDAPPREAWEPTQRFVYTNFIAVRYNPLGLVNRSRFLYRRRLFSNDGALFRGAYIDVGAEVTLAPTFLSGGARVELRPLSMLVFGVTWEAIGYFGVLNAVMPVGSPQDDYWEDTLSARGDAGEHYSTFGSRLTLSATFQAKVKSFILINTMSAIRIDLGLRAGDDFQYDATNDLVFADGGWGIVNDLDTGVMLKDKLALGVRYSYADSLLGTGGPGDLPTHRVGPLFAYTFHTRPSGARFNKPTLLALVQWHAQHPWRAGQRRNAGIPLVAIAFQFEGDLWVGKD